MTAQTTTLIPLQATEKVVDALNQAVELDAGPQVRVEFLLHRLQQLLDRQTRCALWLIEDLARRPAPRLNTRIVVRPEFDDAPLGDLEQAQQAFDAAAPLSEAMVRKVLAQIRTPVTMVLSESSPARLFENVLVPKHLARIGYADSLTSMWAATPERAVFLVCHRREIDRPFDDSDQALMSLMLRGVAPIVDREIFRSSAEEHGHLSPREREILLMLLAGDSEKQIAANLQRSINTVHTFVRQIYREYKVSSRGELMAQFVDKAVIESLRQATGSAAEAEN